MSRKRQSPQETNSLQLIGSIENLSDLWDALGFHMQLRPSSSHSSLSAEVTATKSAGDLREVSEEEVTSADESEEQRRLWTKHVFVDISSDGKFLVLASQKEIAILTAKWRHDKLIFTKLWDGVLAEDSSSEVLTCCLALPLRSRQRSSDGLPDWTCIVYGFKSGFVAFHTERGYSVHRQQFDLQNVLSIKLRSLSCAGAGENLSDQQELVILYEGGIVVVVSGMDLYASLQTFKQQAAAAVSKGSVEDDLIETQSIPHEKFHCDSRQTVHDVISLGVSRISGFDQLLNAAVLGGKGATVKPPLPTFRRFVVVGSTPLCASYFVVEGETSLVLGQVAKAVATKVTTAITSRFSATASRLGLQNFLGRGGGAAKEGEKKQKTLPKSATNVHSRYSLFDARRVATSIVLSATSRMAALTDNFGRVLLLDCASGLIVRMWKGYRESEVAWVTLVDNRSPELPKRFVECLVIFAPRRHLLEVWTALSGRRLVAMRVRQGLRLLPLGADIVANRTAVDNNDHGQHSQCYFLDISGNLFTLNVPFYLVEEDGDAADGHDGQILQELKELVMTGRSSGGKNQNVEELVGSINSYELKDQAVEYLLAHEAGKILPTVVAAILQKEIRQFSATAADEITESMRLINRNWREKLVLIEWLHSLKTNLDSPADSVEEDTEALANSALQDLNSGTFFPLIDAITAAANSDGGSLLDLNISLNIFLSFFERIPDVDEESIVFQLDEEVTLPDRIQFSLLLFSPYFHRKISFTQLKRSFCWLNRREVMHLLLLVWLEKTEDMGGCSSESLFLLERIFLELLQDLQPEELQEYRAVLQDSTHIPAALTGCLAILSAGFQRPILADPDEWESICKEKMEWTRLSNRLESLLSLQNFLVKFMPVGKSFAQAVSLSVTDFLLRGKSAAAEYLASWSSRGFLDIPQPAIMKAFYSTDIEIKLPSTESEDQDDRPLRFLHVPDISLEKKEISEALAVLKAVFPRSLTADVLLSNCSLELAVLWNRNPEETALLNLSLLYLKDVVNNQITHGIALVIWKTFLCERVSSCATLMEKVGKAPKERLFSRDVNMSEASVVVFFELAHMFLTLIAEAEFNRQEVFLLETEYLWHNEAITAKSSVVEMALSQPVTTAPLVRHHIFLVVALHAIVFFNLKSVKPLSLFDFKAREAFFQDFSLHPVLSILELDHTVIRNRNQFLSRVVAALVRSAAEHCIQPDIIWMEKIQDMADYWGIPGDEVRTLYVVELYSNGLDELGAEAYKTVTDKQPLLASLMLLAGQRLASLTSNTRSQTSYANNFSTMSPTLGSWVRSMDSNSLASQNVDWEQCYLLVRNISHDMSRNQAQYKICTEVLEWIQHYILTR